jgi:hypothetical protein
MAEKQTDEQLAADKALLNTEFGNKGYAVLNEDSFAAIMRIAGNSLAEQNEAEAAAGEPAPLPDGVDLHDLGGYCPVQGYGMVDALPFYFRARHEHWSFEVCENPRADIQDLDTDWRADWYTEEAYDGNAGWMTRKEAHDAIITAVARYRAREEQ